MNLDQFSKMRGFQSAHASTNSQIVDHLLAGDQGDEIRKTLLTKRIQFDTAPQLFAQLENVCSLLECSKREFLEMAVFDSIAKAEAEYFAAYKEATGRDFMDVHGLKDDEKTAALSDYLESQE